MAEQSLFGPTPEEIQTAIRQQGQQLAMQWAGMPQGRGQVASMALAGNSLGQGLAGVMGYQDPALRKAMIMEQVKREIDTTGIDFTKQPEEYANAVATALMARGLHNEALQAVSMGIDFASRRAKLEADKAAAVKKDTETKKVLLNNKVYEAVVDKQTGNIISVVAEAPGSWTVDTVGEMDVMKNSDTGEIVPLAQHKFAPAASVTVVNQAQKVTDQTWADISKSYADDIRTAASTAKGAKAWLSALESGIRSGRFKGGFVAVPRAELGKFLEFAGMSSETLNELLGSPNEAEFQSAMTEQLKNQIAQARDTGGLRNLPASEYKRLVENLPGMLKTTEGSLAIANILRKEYDRAIKSEEIFFEEAERRMQETSGTDVTDPIMIKRVNERLSKEQEQAYDPSELDRLRLEARRGAMAADAKVFPGISKAKQGELYIDPITGNPKVWDKNRGLVEPVIRMHK